MGSFLFMGLIGIVIAMVVNIFLKSAMMDFVVSCLGVLIFTGLTAYDTQKLRRFGESAPSGRCDGRAPWRHPGRADPVSGLYQSFPHAAARIFGGNPATDSRTWAQPESKHAVRGERSGLLPLFVPCGVNELYEKKQNLRGGTGASAMAGNVPSHEELLQTLAAQNRPMRLDGLCSVLGLARRDRKELEAALEDLEQQGRALRLRRGLWIRPESLKTITGRFSALRERVL